MLIVAVGVGVVLDSEIAVHMGVTQRDVLAQKLSWGILVGQLVSYVAPLAVIFTLVPWLARRSFRDLGLRPLDARTAGAALLGAIAMYAVTIGLANVLYAFTHQKPQEEAISLFSSTHDPALEIAFGVLAAVIAPFVEELIFRCFLFNALLRYLPVWLAATLSGVFFGGFHLSATAFVPLAGSGIVLAYVYYRSGSLTSSMLAHALFNAVNVALLAIGKST